MLHNGTPSEVLAGIHARHIEGRARLNNGGSFREYETTLQKLASARHELQMAESNNNEIRTDKR